MKTFGILGILFWAFFVQVHAQQPVNPDSLASGDKHLSMRSIGAFTLRYEGTRRISRREFVDKLATYPEAYKQFTSGRNMRVAGGILGIPAGYMVGKNLVYVMLGGGTFYQNRLLLGLFASSVAISLDYIGKAKVEKAVHIYNQSHKIGYRFNINPNGIGLALQF